MGVRKGFCYIKAGERTAWRYFKNNCRRRGVSFSLTLEEFLAFSLANCAYCGSPPRNRVNRRGLIYFYQGVDRMDNGQGYVSGNVVPCCGRCNSIKGAHLSHQEMILVASLLLGLRKLKAPQPGTQGLPAPADSTRSPRKASRR